MNRRKSFPPSFAALLICLFLLALVLSWVDLRQLGDLICALNIRWLIAYICLGVSGIFLRAERYRLLLNRDISVGQLFWVVAVRNAFVDLLPARSGALSYVVILKKRYDVSLAAGTSTLLLALIFDYIIFAPMLMLAIGLSLTGNWPVWQFLFLSSLLFFIGLMMLRWLDRLVSLPLRGLAALTGRLEGRRKTWLESFNRGLDALKEDILRVKGRKGLYWKLTWLSFMVRCSKYGAIYFLLTSLLTGGGTRLESIIFVEVFLATAAAELSSLLPLHSPAGLGSWDMAWTMAFAAMGFSLEMAATTGLAVHLLSKVFEYLLGSAGLLFIFGRKR